jgi:HlyD family secretion protein
MALAIEQPVDRPLQRSVLRRLRMRWRWAVIAAAIAAAAIVVGRRTPGLRIDRGSVQLAQVSRGQFEDFVALTGEVVPRETVLLDAVQGGRVERVLVEDGAAVRRDQPLIQLSNPTIQLEVISRETLLAEQLNNLRNSELAIEQSRVALEREQVELEFQAAKWKRNAAVDAALAPSGAVARVDADDTSETAVYYARRLAVLRSAQRIERQLRQRELQQVEESKIALTRNLEFTRHQLEQLEVRAPVDGVLTALDVHVGQSIAPGARLGQIDIQAGFKIAAHVDQFYAARVVAGQQAILSLGGQDIRITVHKIYPRVDAGRFMIDLVFAGDSPALRRGQTLQLRLFIGEATQSLLVPNGAFLAQTAGSWIFAVTADGRSARRRALQVGRRNPRFVEVLGGVTAGETVIISSYDSFGDATAIALE